MNDDELRVMFCNLEATSMRADPAAAAAAAVAAAAGFYPPAILPLLIVFSITSVETVGDVTATEELSRLDADGENHNRRIKGGMLNGEESSGRIMNGCNHGSGLCNSH
jgi:xanthine/uracil permease